MNNEIRRIREIPVLGVEKVGVEDIPELGPRNIENFSESEEALRAAKEKEAQKMQAVAERADPTRVKRQKESKRLLERARVSAQELLREQGDSKAVQKPTNQVKPTSGIVGWIKGLFG